MNTVKDPDPGAVFLRQVLQMNPAYGSYMQTDKELVGIVQLFAKRLRARMMAANGPLTPNSLYEPLCEMTWRITGHVLHAVLNVDESLDENGLPVPKEPQGQVKMLVQTNMELSRKLNLMRRDYLRELTCHRDKQRSISDEAQEVLQDLQEHPVMFFEPLKFVLDDVTKEFIKLVVEERVKLDQKGAPVKIERRDARHPEKKVTREKPDKALMDELAKVRGDLRKIQDELHTSQIECKRLAASEKLAREQLEKTEELRSKAARQGSTAEDEIRTLRQALEEKEASLKELEESTQSKGAHSAAELKQRAAELTEAQKRVNDLTAGVSKTKEELAAAHAQIKGLQDKLEEAMNSVAQKEASKTKVIDPAMDENLRKELGEALEAEKKLRQENQDLEQALTEERRKKKELQADLAAKKAEVESSAAKAREALQKAAQSQEELALVQAEAQQAQAALAERTESKVSPSKDGPEVRTVTRVVTVEKEKETVAAPAARDGGWKDKCTALEDEKIDLENRIAELNQQVQVLTEKLQEVGGEQAIREVQEKIKLTPVKKKKKKRSAYQRLWEDAQRRIISMRVQAKSLAEEQGKEIGQWRKTVVSEKSIKIIENISKMHKAVSTAQRRLTHAMLQFQAESFPEGEDSQELPQENSQDTLDTQGTQDSNEGASEDMQLHSVWGDDDDEDEEDDGELSPLPLQLPKSSGTTRGGGGSSSSFMKRLGFGEDNDDFFNDSAEVEALNAELAKKERQCQILREEVASLKRMMNLGADGVHRRPSLGDESPVASVDFGIMGFKAPVRGSMAFGHTMSERLPEGREGPRSRSSSASPVKNAQGEYIPPHARPLPKGERYDPSQEKSYLQQLQQISQSKENASQKSQPVMKFKRAVDLIRKAHPETRASLLGDKAVAPAATMAETTTSSGNPSALARFRHTVSAVQKTLKQTVASDMEPKLAPKLQAVRPTLRKTPSADRLSEPSPRPSLGPSPKASPRPSPRPSPRLNGAQLIRGSDDGDRSPTIHIAPSDEIRRKLGLSPKGSPVPAQASGRSQDSPFQMEAGGMSEDSAPSRRVSTNTLSEPRAAGSPKVSPRPAVASGSRLQEPVSQHEPAGRFEEPLASQTTSAGMLAEKPSVAHGAWNGESRATTASSAGVPGESRATTAGSVNLHQLGDPFPAKGTMLPALTVETRGPAWLSTLEEQTAPKLTGLPSRAGEPRMPSSGSGSQMVDPRGASNRPSDASPRSSQAASWAAAAVEKSMHEGARKPSAASAIRSEQSSSQASRAQTPQLDQAPPWRRSGPSGTTGASRSRPQSQGSAKPEQSQEFVLGSFGYKAAESRSQSKLSKGSRRSVPSDASSPERTASEAGRLTPTSSAGTPVHAVPREGPQGKNGGDQLMTTGQRQRRILSEANHRQRTGSVASSGKASHTAPVVSMECAPVLVPEEPRSQTSSSAASKEAAWGKAKEKFKRSRTVPTLPAPGVTKPLLHSSGSTLPALEGAEGDRRSGSAEELGTAEFPQRSRHSRDRFGSQEWDKAPVKPRSKDMMVTAMRSQEWMSQVA